LLLREGKTFPSLEVLLDKTSIALLKALHFSSKPNIHLALAKQRKIQESSYMPPTLFPLYKLSPEKFFPFES
jgi:hypothetical protein